MALKDFLSLHDPKLAETYEYVAPNKTLNRKPFLSGLTLVERQFGEGRQPRNGMWSANNNVVRFEPKLGSSPVKIEGETVFHIPAERFAGALASLRKEVEAGTLDDALHEAVEATGKRNAGEKIDPSVGSVRAGWSPERRAKFEASIAAKKNGK